MNNKNLVDYKREMVTLQIPYKNEERGVLADMQFLQMYVDNEVLIMERRKEFESNLDVEKAMRICSEVC